MAKKLYVGNLQFDTTEAQIRELFSQVGQIESIALITDRETGRPRGFAFVEMNTDAEAQAAIQQFNDYALGGRNLTVNEARPKPERSFGGGGGSRRSEPRW